MHVYVWYNAQGLRFESLTIDSWPLLNLKVALPLLIIEGDDRGKLALTKWRKGSILG